ncbi:NAD(P)H-binding protein [Kribbella sp. NPDC051587]|uniref:NAD(P)H-binding protein n=1 Tax=Kribbella sp. NPDC051587 TaxID=3364119 RepID=UPI0037928AF8
MTTFAVLGGTGKVGRRLTRILTTNQHDARPVSRSTPIRFDWRDESTWPAALERAEGVFIVGPGSATDWSSTLARFLKVAGAAGVQRAVLLSARGVEFAPDGVVAAAESALRAGSLDWTILRPTHFAQNFTEAMFVPVDGRIVVPVGEAAHPFLDVEDLAEVAAVVLAGGEYGGQVLELSGPEAITFAAAAEALAGRTGESAVFVSEGAEDHVARLRAAGTPEGYISWRMAMLNGIRSGADAYVSDGVAEVLGRPATPFGVWAAREAGTA